MMQRPSAGSVPGTSTLTLPWVESPFFEHELARRLDRLRPEQVQQARSYHENGYLAVSGMVPGELCDRVRAESEPFFDEAWSLENRRIQDAWQRGAESVRELALFQPVQDLLQTLYERRPVPFQTLDFKFGTQQREHADCIHFSCLPARYMCGVWVALEDVEPGSGPLFYYPGSHRLAEINLFDLGEAADDARYNLYESFQHDLMNELGIEPVEFYAKKGDILIWSSNIVHGGRDVTVDGSTRWSQVTHFYFEDCVYYAPFYSEIPCGELKLKSIVDLNSQEPVEHRLNGRPVLIEDCHNGRSRISIVAATGASEDDTTSEASLTEVASLRQELEAAQLEVAAFRASASYRVGYAMLEPLRAARRQINRARGSRGAHFEVSSHGWRSGAGARAAQVSSERADELMDGHHFAYHLDYCSADGVVGWVLHPAGIEEVRVLTNGRQIGRAIPGMARPDVAAVHSQIPDAGASGFAIVVADWRVHTRETLTVEFVARDGAVWRTDHKVWPVRSNIDVSATRGPLGSSPLPADVMLALSEIRPDHYSTRESWDGETVERAVADIVDILTHRAVVKPVLRYAQYLHTMSSSFRYIASHFDLINRAAEASAQDILAVATSPSEMLCIANHLYVLRSRGVVGHFVECGCFKGFSTCCLSQACRVARSPLRRLRFVRRASSLRRRAVQGGGVPGHDRRGHRQPPDLRPELGRRVAPRFLLRHDPERCRAPSGDLDGRRLVVFGQGCDGLVPLSTGRELRVQS